jgi:hypothetical protein
LNFRLDDAESSENSIVELTCTRYVLGRIADCGMEGTPYNIVQLESLL